MRALIGAFLWIGLVSFGGGRITYFQDALVLRRRWFSADELLEAVALSQVLPGPTVGNLAAYLGQRLHGWLGALAATACVTIPGGLMIVGLAVLYFHGMPASVSTSVGKGVSATSVGLAIATVFRLRTGIRGLREYVLAGLTFVLFGPLHWPIHWVLAVCLPLGLVSSWRTRR